MIPTAQFQSAGVQSFNAVVQPLADLRACPMTGGYALARESLTIGLEHIRLLWGKVASTGTYDPVDYQIAQASLTVAARYAPLTPPVTP